MKIKIIFLNLLLFFFISGEAFSENYYCKIANTTPKLDLNSLPFKDVGISIDYINKKAIDIAKKRFRFIHSGVRGKNTPTTNPSALRREAVNIFDDIQLINPSNWS